MSIYKYLRYSSDMQDERQQENTIDSYLAARGLVADATYTDAATSGSVSYRERNLFDLCKELKPNDTIIISEISRLTRSGIAELSEIIEKYFKPNKLHLIVCNVGLDIDCSDLNPLVEMQLMMMAVFAKIERQLLRDRTRSAMAVRQKLIAENGGFISKSGRWTDHIGGNSDMSAARAISSKNRMTKAKENPINIFFFNYVTQFEERNGKMGANTPTVVFAQLAKELNALGQKTVTGLDYTANRCRALYYKMKDRYVYLK
jgi:DNA invertase Pin-like site-specific DNA recombinase